jgi:ribosomal protein L32
MDRKQQSIETLARYNSGPVPALVEISDSGDDLVCPACHALNEEILTADDAPILPYEKCTNPDGCRCTYLPVVDDEIKPTLRKCPHCGELIKQHARSCRHCGQALLVTPKPESFPQSIPQAQSVSTLPDRGRQLAIFAAIGLIISAFFPWATISIGNLHRTIYGFQGDGIFTAILGLLLLLFTAAKKGWPAKLTPYAALISGILGLVITGPKFFTITQAVTESSLATASFGLGLYLGVASAILAVVAFFTERISSD